MKFWNKSINTRRCKWTKVYINRKPGTTQDTIKHQLQNLPSTGKFFVNWFCDYVQFEHEDDAMHFKLTFGQYF